MDFSSFFISLGIDPQTLKGITQEKLKEKVLSAFKQKETELSQNRSVSALTLKPLLQSKNTLLEYLTDTDKFSILSDWITYVPESEPKEPLSPGGAITSNRDEVFKGEKEISSSFKKDLIDQAYTRFYKGENIVQINTWLREQGVTSWELEPEEKEINGAKINLPKLILNKKGYLRDSLAEVSMDENRTWGVPGEQKQQLSPTRSQNNSGIGSITRTVLRNYVTFREMQDMIDGADAIAQYELFGENTSPDVKQKAQAYEVFKKSQSEAVDFNHLISAQKGRYNAAAQSQRETKTPSSVEKQLVPSLSAMGEKKA